MSIEDALKVRYPAPAWALFFEVASGTGYSSRRYADALAMSLFPSRGLEIHGFEVKRDRGDWLRELKNPQKADEIASYCDYWWMVTPEGVINLEELPKPWGWLLYKEEFLNQKKAAKTLKAKSLSRPFVAALLRRANEFVERSLGSRKDVNKAFEDGIQRGRTQAKEDVEIATRELAKFKEGIAEFEKNSGLKINPWNAGNIGNVVATLQNFNIRDSVEELEYVTKSVEASAATLRGKTEALKKLKASKKEKAIT